MTLNFNHFMQLRRATKKNPNDQIDLIHTSECVFDFVCVCRFIREDTQKPVNWLPLK